MNVWLFAALLVLWGNLVLRVIGASVVLPGGGWPYVFAGAVLVVLSLLAARALGLDATACGLRRDGAIRGAALGAVLAGAIAVLDVVVLRSAPAIIGRPVLYEPLLRITADDLAVHIAFFLPLGAVIPEEIAFRGTLLGAFARRMNARSAVTASAVVFALWHAAVAYVTVADTTLGPPSPLFVPAVAGALLVLFVGGVIMAVLRLVTGTVATTIAAHWVFNAVILVGLWTTPTPTIPSA